jgi:hypothetical protein
VIALAFLTIGPVRPGVREALGQSGPPPSAQAERAPPPWATRGLTISGGLGYAYGLLGAQARYDLPFKMWLRVAPFLSGGTLGSIKDKWLMASTGLSASVGYRHRAALDLTISPVAFQDLILHGTVVDHRTLYGPVVAAGYEFFSSGGFMMRVLFGYGWGVWSRGDSPSISGLSFVLGLGGRVGERQW